MAAPDMGYYDMMANPDYSPSRETFSYPNRFDNFCDSSPYSNHDTSFEETAYSPMYRCLSHAAPSSTSSTADGWPNFHSTLSGPRGDSCDAFTGTEVSGSLGSRFSLLPMPGWVSPEHVLPVPECSSTSGSSSLRSLERGSSISDASCHQFRRKNIAKSTPRKRGRPCLNRDSITDDSSTSSGARRSTCLPHKQVERKYREGLNMEFERLRRAVPTLPQSTEASTIGATKPSKGMVLAAAIDYIGRIERERDAATDEVVRLGGTVRVRKFEQREEVIMAA